MNRFQVWTVAVTLAAIVLAPIPAHAASVWDPNERGHRQDIRWVGVYHQADGRLRVTMTFYDPVRIWWFGAPDGRWHVVAAMTNNSKRHYAEWDVAFFRNPHNNLSAELCQFFNGCFVVASVARPNAFTIRSWIRPPDCCVAGWALSAYTPTARGPFIDTTKRGIVS